jgi:hypothetical protein
MSTSTHRERFIVAPLRNGGVISTSRPTSVDTMSSVARPSALGRAWGAIRPEMTLSNYARQVVCCRDEAAGPMAEGAFQTMRRGLQRQSSRWSCGRAEAHASPCRTDLRRPRMGCTAELLQGGHGTAANSLPAFGHGVAEKPWGRPIFHAQHAAEASDAAYTHTDVGGSRWGSHDSSSI